MSYVVLVSAPLIGGSMFGELVTRRRRTAGAPDRYGNPTYTWSDVLLGQGAAFDPGGSREPVEVGREQVVTTPRLYFVDRPDLTADDRVLVRGIEYAVEGTPADWRDPFGSDVGGLVVELERVTG
ncbi:hypothetical protein GCM10025865_01190 [Paraoerskovia sediminicola]|uniref:Head-to-tail stopper n=1 Tax=Paraoerskovia sediminicola TaxID=1138587 RepID=A0ABM8FYW3_9CELL|nr:head-tail adaptor protein [Paraoerskovia sediminicola]BDZ40820.1 hypothetical protein GCM10025865_01190 [Paraoerskovia sediminicola]